MIQSGEKIVFDNSKLIVPNFPIIPFIEGDGIGSDIWYSAKLVFDQAVYKAYKGQRQIKWLEIFAGQKSFETDGDWLPQKTLDGIKEYLISIKGPLTTPIGGGFRSLNVTLRQVLDLYANVRPLRYFQGVPSPVKHPEYVNMTVFRENTEDIYAGIEYLAGTGEANRLIKFLQDEMHVTNIRFPQTSSIGIKPVSKEGSTRLIRAAINYAIANNQPSVTLVHKGNIMKYTEGKFREWGYELAEQEFAEKVFTWNQYNIIERDEGKDVADKAMQKAIASAKIIIKDVIADSFLQQILTRPQEYSVIATLNLNGDYITDALAAQVGGIGIAPGANINYDTGHALFEAVHGTAPKYAGLDQVNPSSLILSGTMMFEYMGWIEVRDLIIKAFEKTIENKTVTYDIERMMDGAKLMKTSEFAEEIIRNMNGKANSF